MDSNSAIDQEVIIDAGATKGKVETGEFFLQGKQGSFHWLSLVFVGGVCFYANTTQAATRYWDPNGTAVNNGGSGAWEGSLVWSASNDGVSGPYGSWNPLDDAIFGGTAGTVTLGGPFTAHNLTFATNGYVINGSTLTLGGVTPTITTNAGVGANINSILAGNFGAGGLTKDGTGALGLNGVNTFIGNINVNAGTLVLNADAALGNAANGLVMANGTALSASGALAASRVVTLNGSVGISGAGTGSARYTGTGGLLVRSGITMSHNANDYTGATSFDNGSSGGNYAFTSIADLGVASSLGAPTTAATGTISADSGGGVGTNVTYTGTGHSSNRNWSLSSAGASAQTLLNNNGTGTLSLTGNITVGGSGFITFNANSADINLPGVINGGGLLVQFAGTGAATRTITLGTANTFTTPVQINNVKVIAGKLADTGTASSFGTGTGGAINIVGNGILSYTGSGDSSNRAFAINNGTFSNNGTGALLMTGTLGISNSATLGGSFIGAVNNWSGVISGAGNLIKATADTWVLNGANTYTGPTTVNSGILRAGSASAFGTTSSVVVNGGTLDFNDFSYTVPSLAGTGGVIDLGTGTLTLNAPAATNTSYAGNITGAGGLTKAGASTQTLTGANTYTGATTINAGTLRLDFTPAGGPTNSIISNVSTLNMAGGTINVIGAAGESNTQTFNGLNVTAGNNTIGATSGAGGSLTINLGSINRTGGLVNFNLPVSGNITTTNTALGGWATVNGTDYAKVVGGNILPFTPTDYVNKDNASTWLDSEFVSDAGGAANTPFNNTVAGTKQLGGLKYAAAAASTVTVGAGNTLGVDGTIIVGTTVGATNQTITGGSITGLSGGGALGVQQNSTGNFTIASQIVNNGGVTSFVKSGTGLVTLTNANSNYTGATTVAQGVLSVGNIGMSGAASGIGASSAASSNLNLEGSTLRYTGANTSSDRGFTFAKSGAILGSNVEVTNVAANLAFSGLVTSPDGANFTKLGLGTLTLSNAGNDYTGITTVTSGTLAVSTLANGGLVSGIGASSNASTNLVLSGGTLAYLGGTTSTDRGFTVGNLAAGVANGAIGVSNAATTLTMSGTVVGDDGLRKEGPGTLVLSGTNTYTGGTTVNAGTLRAGSTQAFGNNANNLTVTSGATADINGLNVGIGALIGGGSVTLGSGTLTSNVAGGNFSGVISGTGGYTQGGGFGTGQTMAGNNTYTGVTNINGGQLNVDSLANGGLTSGIGASSSASSNLVFNTGILKYTGGSVSIDRGFTAASGVAAIDVSNAATTLQISGTVLGGGAVRKDGPGILVLSGNNTHTGGAQVTGGILRAGSATAFGNPANSGALTMSDVAGAALDANGFNQTFAGLSGGGTTGGNINMGAQTLTIRDGGNLTYSGNINGTGGLVKNGTGTQWLTGCNNTYSGGTTINNGIMAVNCMKNGGANSALGTSSSAAGNLVIGSATAATLWYNGAGDSSDRLFTIGTGGATIRSQGTGALNLTNTGTIALAGTNAARTLTLTGTNTGDNTLSAQLDNNGTGVTSLTKTDTGTWNLTNNNSSYTGVTTISGGVLGVSQLANGGVASGLGASSSAASNLVIGNGSTLRYTGSGDNTDRLFTLASGVSFVESSGTGAINFTNTGTIGLANPNVDRTVALGGTNTGDNTLAGVIGNAGTGITTLAKNGPGTWVLTGDNTYTGNTVVNDGDLKIGDGNTSGNLGTGNVIVSSPTSTLSMNRSDTVIFDAVMSGPGSFAQIGDGTTTLTASNSIGSTRVSGGTLDVNGTLDTATIAMSNTSTLNVDGTVEAAGGTASAITGDAGASTVIINSGAILRANGDLGAGSDVLNVVGTLDTGASALSLGAGDDTLTLNDGAVIAGLGVDAGTGSADNLVVNNALALTFGGAGVAGFEALTKQNAGTLTLTNNQSYSAGTTLSGGTLDVNGSLETPTVAMSAGTTLNVDGTVQAVGGATTMVTGSTGAETINVNSGATLLVNGDLGDGTDTVTVSGTVSGTGTLSLGDGADTLTLNDGAVLNNVISGGGGIGDTLVLNNASALTFNGSNTGGFESLQKDNGGTATMTGSQSFIGGTNINAGVLDIDGNLETPTVGLAGGATLNVDGTVQAAGGTTATLTGDAGSNTVTVGAAGSLLAAGDLGAGTDTLDVSGTLNTGGGELNLGDGNDNFIVHDGTVVIGTVDGGAGLDTRTYDINTTADLGALAGFEGLTKTGNGVLNINGPGATDLQEVEVLDGILDVHAGAGIVAPVGGTLDTTVAAGAILNVDGSYTGGTNNDTFDLSGTVSGTGTINLGDGADTLTLNDGAVLNNAIGGGTGTGDTLVLNNASALTFDGGNTGGFELLQKDNGGTATMTGTQSFSGGTNINAGVLDIDGILNTPTVGLAGGATLNVDGTVQAAGGTTATLTGDAGSNIVTVGAGGSLLAAGNLGAGIDTLDVFGSLNTGGGVLNLGDGADSFTIHDGTVVTGTVDGGAGLDTFNSDIDTSADLGALAGFEILTKTGIGELNINGPGTSTFNEVNVNEGTLNLASAATVTAPVGGSLDTTVAGSATLNVDGSLIGGANSDSLTVAGTVTGGGTIDLAGGDDVFTIQDGADLSGLTNSVSGGTGNDTFAANIAGQATLGGASSFETLTKTNTGTLLVAGPDSSDFSTVDVQGGTLDIGTNGSISGVQDTTVAANTILKVDGSYTGSAGNDIFDLTGTVSGTGTIDLGDGADTLTLNDGAVINNAISGGAGTGDTLVLNNANAMIFNGGNTGGFELLQKDNGGTATITGSQSFIGGTSINAGVLDIDGTLNTPIVDLAGGATLNVDGTVQAAGGTTATLTGDAGSNIVTVGSGGNLLAAGDLGAGTDTLNVSGTLNTGGGELNLGDGNDNFIVHDGTVVIGTVDGGAGLDTRTYDINTTADLGALAGFEGLTKTGTGVLNINGPGATDLQEVEVLGGTLDVHAGASIVAPVGGTLDTTVATGAILNVAGNYTGGIGDDTFDLSGTVSGTGTIDLGDGADTLTLNDGAVLNNAIGGGAGTGDTLVLNNANAMIFNGGNTGGFELLQKDNGGTATMTGSQSFSGGTNINAGVLEIDGILNTPIIGLAGGATLNVDGTVQAAGGTTAALTGDAGSNVVTVGAGGSLLAAGNLGAGIDTLDVSGTLNTGVGVLNLGDGADSFTIHDGTVVIGTVDGGAGLDTFNPDIDTSADLGALVNFEILTKTGTGELNINGPGASTFNEVNVNEGTLNLASAATVTAPVGGSLDTTVADNATLNVDGSLIGGGNIDSLTVAGTVTGSGTIDLAGGADVFTIQDGADLSGLTNSVSGGTGNDTFVADIAGQATLGGASSFETLTKTNTGTLLVAGPAPSDFSTVDVQGGTLDIGANGSISGVQDTTVAANTILKVDGDYTGSAGDDTFDLSGTVSGTGTIDLGDGADTLTLNDGAVLANAIGGGAGSNDTLVLNNANAMNFDGGNTGGFELLQKDNGGTATMTGSQSFIGGTSINAGVLDIDGTLETPTVGLAGGATLNVDGTVQAAGGTTATLTGDAGSNVVTVGAAGSLLAAGNLGAGTDTLDVSGSLDTGVGVLNLGDGDDNFVVHDDTVVIGTVDGGAGLDTRTYDINTTADLGALVNFEGITKTGTGVLNINGPGATDLQEVDVLGGTLDVHAGASIVASVGETLATTVAAGATLNVDGSYTGGAGDDTFDLSGTVSGTGAIDLGDGADILTLNDGAVLNNAIGGGAGTGDTLVLNNASALTFDGGNTGGFELLRKDNDGTATMTGSQSFIGGTSINAGELDIDGTLETPTVGLAGGATLNVDGTVQAAGGTTATLTGDAGSNIVIVGAGGSLLAAGDLGDGTDTLDVSGTLDTGVGALNLGDGADSFTIHDGTVVIGTVDGGAGLDTFNPDIDTSADLGALVNFEILTKTGTGALNINGPGASTFNEVNVNEGTLNLASAATVTAPVGGSLDTTVADNATLNVDGSLIGGDNIDSLTVAGTVTGSGTIDLAGGDDIFTIQDGADLSGLTNSVSGGTGNDTFVADIAGQATLGGAINFETLTKTNTGTLLVAGPAPSDFPTVNVQGGTLDIGANGSISGVNNATVAGGATLNVDGDLLFTPGADVFTVAGTVTGLSDINMLDGDDSLVLQDGANLSGLAGPINGGDGDDSLITDIAGQATLGGATNFETLTKTNTGTLLVAGPAPSDFTTVNVQGGTLDIGTNGSISGVMTTNVDGGTTLNVDGSYKGSAGDDIFRLSGTVSGSGTIDLGTGADQLVLNDGAVLGNIIDGGDGNSDEVLVNNARDLTFEAESVEGFEKLTKDNTGTLTLLGAHEYTSGVTIRDGVLQVGAGGTSGSLAGNVLNDGALNFNRSDSYTFAGSISGSGNVGQIGGGVTTLTGVNTYTGLTNVTGGVLRAGSGGAFSSGSGFLVGSNGRLDLSGFDQTVGSLSNAGLINLSLENKMGTTLNVLGDYRGSGGEIVFNTVFGDDGSRTDRLVIGGNTTGTTNVRVNNIGGEGAQTGNGILLIDVVGSSDGQFTLLGDFEFQDRPSIVSGAYAYSLFQGGVSSPGDGNWYLRSALMEDEQPQLQPGVPIYEAYSATLQILNKPGTLQQRVGNRSWSEDSGNGDDDGYGAWTRTVASHASFEPEVTSSGMEYDADTILQQSGYDAVIHSNEYGQLVGGIFGQFGTVASEVFSPHGNGHIETKGYGVGGTLTWYGKDGFYVDSLAQSMWYESDLSSSLVDRQLASDNNGGGESISLEAGRRIATGEGLSITPQAQLTYSGVRFDEFNDAFDVDVSSSRSHSLVGRLGMAYDLQRKWRQDGRMHLYGIANAYHDFDGRSRVLVGGTQLETENDDWSAGAGFGWSLNWADDKYSFYGEIEAGTSLENFGDSNSVKGTIGFRMLW